MQLLLVIIVFVVFIGIVPNILSDVVADWFADLDLKVKVGLFTFLTMGLIIWINSLSKPKVPWRRD